MRDLIAQAKRLTPEEQADIVDALLEGLSPGTWYSQDDLAEWRRRAAEARANRGSTVPADIAIAQVRASLARMRKPKVRKR